MLTNPLDLLCFVENLTEPETKKLTEIIQTIIDANEKTGVVIYQDGCILIASKFARKVIHEEDIQDFMHTNFFLSQTKEVKEQLLTNIFSLSEETYYITLNIDDYQIRFKTTPKILHLGDRCYRFTFSMPETENQQRAAQKAEFDISNRYSKNRFNI
jgi:hypothetical protein